MILVRLHTETGALSIYELRASEVLRRPRAWAWSGGCSAIDITISRARLRLYTFRHSQILRSETCKS